MRLLVTPAVSRPRAVAASLAGAPVLASPVAGPVTVGLDFGTSGARLVALGPAPDAASSPPLYEASVAWAGADDRRSPAAWRAALLALLGRLPPGVAAACGALAVAGTSGTALLVEAATGEPATAALMYDDACADALPALAALLQAAGPGFAAAGGATSGLAKLLHWKRAGLLPPRSRSRSSRQTVRGGAATPQREPPPPPPQQPQPRALSLAHQSDWVALQLCGVLASDWHSALKSGFDVADGRLCWPPWLVAALETGEAEGPGEEAQGAAQRAGEREPAATAAASGGGGGGGGGGAGGLATLRPVLPPVYPPGSPVARLLPAVADALGLPRWCVVAAGTTDSCAAFFAAAGAAAPVPCGLAVTSLGSTIALKLACERRVEDPAAGVYSHRLPPPPPPPTPPPAAASAPAPAPAPAAWLAGGASNAGGAVLAALFGPAEALRALSARIRDPARPSGLDYYPLLRPGERFPVCDPALAPRLEPRPGGDDPDPLFLHGVLDGLAAVEAQGYARLAALGAPLPPPPAPVLTAGGGAASPQWAAARGRALGRPVARAPGGGEAAAGAALLARRALGGEPARG